MTPDEAVDSAVRGFRAHLQQGGHVYVAFYEEADARAAVSYALIKKLRAEMESRTDGKYVVRLSTMEEAFLPDAPWWA